MKSKDMEPFYYSRNNSLRHLVYYKKTNPKKVCYLQEYIFESKPLETDQIFMFMHELFMPIPGKLSFGIGLNRKMILLKAEASLWISSSMRLKTLFLGYLNPENKKLFIAREKIYESELGGEKET